MGRNELVLARAARATLAPPRTALVVIASVSDSASTTPLNGFAVWLTRPGAYPGDSLGPVLLSDSLSTIRIERTDGGEHIIRVRRISFRALRGRVELRPGFVDTVFAHLRTDPFCLRYRPAAH